MKKTNKKPAFNKSSFEKQRQEILRRRALQQALDNKICP